MSIATRHMKATELTFMAAAWTMVTWIGMDMYLPALPLLDNDFSASEALINTTLLAYQVAMAVGALLGGAVSDRLGRRAPLITGALLFVAFNVLCAATSHIWVLVVSRFIAGLGGGFVGAIVMAIISDELEGEVMDRAVTITQSLIIIGPVAAPFLGSLMIGIAGWRGIFAALAFLGLVCTIWILPMAETLPKDRRAEVTVLGSLGLLVKVGRNSGFTLLLIALSCPSFCFGVFMTECSYIYIDDFGLGNLGYSVCYAVTTVVSIAGPFIYLAWNKRRSNRRIVPAILIALFITGVLMLLIGPLHAVLFLVTCMPFALAESMARPCAYLVLLREAEDNAGSASALIGFAIGILCALGTPAASLPWSSHITCLGSLVALAGVVGFAIVALLLWGLKSHILDDEAAE